MQTFQRVNTSGGDLSVAPSVASESLPASVTSDDAAPVKPPRSPSSPVLPMRIAAVVPAYNEEKRIGRVIETLRSIPEIDQIVVVNDGSTDETARVASGYCPDIVFVDLPVNRGKGGAMLQGARAAQDAEVVLFLDGDLIGLSCDHVRALAAPVVSGDADMSVGQFRGGRGLTDLAQLLMPYISGQRAIRRSLFLEVPDLEQVGYGIEMAITTYVKSRRGTVEMVTLRGVTHPMKEEKLGFIKGARSRLRMYSQMLKFVVKYKVTPRRPR